MATILHVIGYTDDDLVDYCKSQRRAMLSKLTSSSSTQAPVDPRNEMLNNLHEEVRILRLEIDRRGQSTEESDNGKGGDRNARPKARGRAQSRGASARGRARSRSQHGRGQDDQQGERGGRKIPAYNREKKSVCMPESTGIIRPRQNYGVNDLESHIRDPSEFTEEFLDSLWSGRKKRNWIDYVGAEDSTPAMSRIRVEGRRNCIDSAHTYPRGQNDMDFRHHLSLIHI